MSNDSTVPDNGQAGKPTPVPGTSFEDQCSLLALGYRPIPINGKAPRWSGWPEGVSRPSRLEAIRAENPDHENTGILTGDLVMADVDLRDLCLANSYYFCKSPSFHRLVNPRGNGTIGVHA